jgi:hypothetical protein
MHSVRNAERGLWDRGKAVTLLKSRTLCFKTICSRGITEVIDLTAISVYYCPCSSSQPSRCATFIKWPVLLSQEGTETALAFLTLAVLATWDIRSQKTTNFSDGCPK